MTLEYYYYVLFLIYNPQFSFYFNNYQNTEQDVRKALGLNYSDFNPNNSGYGEWG